VLHRPDDEDRNGPVDAHEPELLGDDILGAGAEGIDDPRARPCIEEVGGGFGPRNGAAGRMGPLGAQERGQLASRDPEERGHFGERHERSGRHPEETRQQLAGRERRGGGLDGHGR
jgi:hypothetical protein